MRVVYLLVDYLDVPIPLDVWTMRGALGVWFSDLCSKATGPALASSGPVARADATSLNSPTIVYLGRQGAHELGGGGLGGEGAHYERAEGTYREMPRPFIHVTFLLPLTQISENAERSLGHASLSAKAPTSNPTRDAGTSRWTGILGRNLSTASPAPSGPPG